MNLRNLAKQNGLAAPSPKDHFLFRIETLLLGPNKSASNALSMPAWTHPSPNSSFQTLDRAFQINTGFVTTHDMSNLWCAVCYSAQHMRPTCFFIYVAVHATKVVFVYVRHFSKRSQTSTNRARPQITQTTCCNTLKMLCSTCAEFEHQSPNHRAGIFTKSPEPSHGNRNSRTQAPNIKTSEIGAV